MDAIAEAVSKTIRATLGEESAPISAAPSSACLKIIDEALAAHAAAT